MRQLGFGDKVIVRHETIRVNRRDDGERILFWQSNRSRERHRFQQRDLSDIDDWPGVPIPIEWERAATDRFVLEPDDSKLVVVRLRRVPVSHPEVGVIIGFTNKTEGTVYETGDDSERSLGGPGRRINLYEVALPPARGKSRVVLVHPRDALPIPADAG